MKLQYLILFTNQTKEIQTNFESQMKQELSIEWNPNSLPHGITTKNVLVVTDTAFGSTFAKEHHLPYIAKWDSFKDSLEDQPVCYYDNLTHLNYEYLLHQWQRAHHLPWTVATGERIQLKELSIQDVETLYSLRQAPNVSKYLPPLDSLSIELEKHKSYIHYQYEFFDYGLWGIFLKDGTLIGQAGIQNCDYQGQTWLELQYFVSANYQHRGYASEALLLIYQYIVHSLEQNEVLAIIADSNLYSIKTAMNLGMKRKGSIRYHSYECHYYVLESISTFLTTYEEEKKRRAATIQTLHYSEHTPVQNVYHKYFRKK